ncbi:C40 family peptidase [Pseudoflavonifractor phocaeensis]|uniref:C40 family peptidase n=1 Tax=Pseudoflavonifractor phocaeensis TaxID=1870988 RepID=UPI00195EEA08|nr:C40 family peptidase [Pseudoflavonifractor phocaeensis]MBM6937294.1 C40 family peptidase [Pseudoflavonifractor phocaeensis]
MIQPVKVLRTVFLTAVVSAACIVSAAAASVGVGTVTADALRLRENASTESTILATAAKGDSVIILADAGNNWYKVDYRSVQGYMSGEYLTVATTADAAIGYGKVSAGGSSLNLRSGAGTSYSIVSSLPDGTIVEIVGIDNGWYKVQYSGKTGYVSSDYMVTVKDSVGSRSTAEAAASSAIGDQIVAYAKQFLGTPYVYGGNGPNSFDCSGFTKYVYSHFGVTLNRTATDQLANGTAVSKSELQPGDLVFFRANTTKPVSHVGIYIGNGQFIHASTNTYSVQIDTLSSGYYSRVYVYGRHIL